VRDAVTDVTLIAVREMRERLRSKAFIGTTLFTVILVVGVIVVGSLLGNTGIPTYRVGLTPAVPEEFADALRVTEVATGAIVDTRPVTDRPTAETAIEEGDLHAAVLDDGTILVERVRGSELEALLTVALQQTAFIERLGAAGLTPDQVADLFFPTGRIEVQGVAPDRNEEEGLAMAMAGVVLLFIVISSYGQWVLIGVLEEKSTGVIELVAAAIPIRHLLAGKVIGIGLLGLAQMLLLIGIGLGAGLTLNAFDLPATALSAAVWSIVWFLLGFALYAVINAAAGSLVSRQEDAQAAAMPIGLSAVAVYLVTFMVIVPRADSTTATILSLLPPVAPIAFPARIALGAAAPWEIALGIVLTLAAVYGVIRLAARVYAGALLQTGARLKWRQAWRSARDVGAD